MDELLEVVELFGDFGLDGAIAWLFRLLGVLAILGGLGLWLLTDITIVIPVVLVVAGFVLLIIPELLLGVVEVVG